MPKQPAKKRAPWSPPSFGKKRPARKVPATAKAQKSTVSEETKKEEEIAMTVRLPRSVHLALRRMAKADQRSAAKQVEMLIRREAEERARLAKPAIPTIAAPNPIPG